MKRRVMRHTVSTADEDQAIFAGPVVLFAPDHTGEPGRHNFFDVWVEALVPDDWPYDEGERTKVRIFSTAEVLPAGAFWVSSHSDGVRAYHLYDTSGVPGR